jgi:hypothetical protein
MIPKPHFTCIALIVYWLSPAYIKPDRFHVAAKFMFYTLQKHTLTKVMKIYNHIKLELHSTITPALQVHVVVMLVLMIGTVNNVGWPLVA